MALPGNFYPNIFAVFDVELVAVADDGHNVGARRRATHYINRGLTYDAGVLGQVDIDHEHQPRSEQELDNYNETCLGFFFCEPCRQAKEECAYGEECDQRNSPGSEKHHEPVEWTDVISAKLKRIWRLFHFFACPVVAGEEVIRIEIIKRAGSVSKTFLDIGHL